MPVVINEFEVVPEPPRREGQATDKKQEGNSKPEPPTDHEVEQMLVRRTERSERVSAH